MNEGVQGVADEMREVVWGQIKQTLLQATQEQQGNF